MSDQIEKEMGRKTRRSLLAGGMAALAGFGTWEWITHSRDADGIELPLRRGLEFNEKVSRGLFSKDRLAPEFPVSEAPLKVRLNEDIGNSPGVSRANWKVRVEGVAGQQPADLPLSRIKALPHVEHTTELKCVEGWSQLVHWGGARFADFAKEFPPADGTRYVSMVTPDEEYYVGLDLESAMQPQTLLCYEMSGQPLEDKHGAPLRLCIPTKYGIKNIKQIGKIAYTKEKPDDYWAERGYDFYAGL